MHAFAHRLACERGQALIEGLLALGLVLLTVCFAMKALAYAHARAVAIATAQEGARAPPPAARMLVSIAPRDSSRRRAYRRGLARQRVRAGRRGHCP
jgi:hypothetical protein